MGTALVESVRSDPFNGYVLKSVCLESKKSECRLSIPIFYDHS